LDDVERQVVADHDGKEEFDADRQRYSAPRRQLASVSVTEIDNAVAKVAEGKRRLFGSGR
jgi:hypothetical protein